MESLLERAGGINGLERMLRDFYGAAREDELIGPIFNGAVEDWEYHLQKVVIYWRRQTEGHPNVRQTFPTKHGRFVLEEDHFRRWLKLFGETCARHFAPPTSDALNDIAHKVAGHLYMDLHRTDEPRDFRGTECT